MCIANAPFEHSSVRQGKVTLRICLHSKSQSFSGCDQCYSLWCRWPVGNSTNPASRGLLRMWAIISHSHLVHANSSSRPPLFPGAPLRANTNQMSSDPNAGFLPTPVLDALGYHRMSQMHAERLSEQSVNGRTRKLLSMENR